jgi:hypothetical protein
VLAKGIASRKFSISNNEKGFKILVKLPENECINLTKNCCLTLSGFLRGITFTLQLLLQLYDAISGPMNNQLKQIV